MSKGMNGIIKGPQSDEHKRKLRVARKGRSGTFIGRQHTEETKQKIREKRKLQTKHRGWQNRSDNNKSK
jgi:hypothetical protein